MNKQLAAWKRWLLDCARYARANAPPRKKSDEQSFGFDLGDGKGAPPVLGRDLLSRWKGGGRDTAFARNDDALGGVIRRSDHRNS